MKIIGYVSRGVRLLVAPWRASSQSIWHWKLVTKGLCTIFKVLMFFILLLTVSTGFDLSHLGGWVDRRRCPPRPRARIGLAGLGPMKSV